MRRNEIVLLLICLIVFIISTQNPLKNITTTGQYCSLNISIKDVFGKPVPNAIVKIGNMQFDIKDGGDGGEIAIPRGVHELTIYANGYIPHTKKLSITGDKDINLKYETGLWPSNFEADFNVYYIVDYDDLEYAYAEIVLANGANEKYMLKKCWIESSAGKVVKNILTEESDYKAFIGTYSDYNYTLEPEPAVIIRPKVLYKTSPFNIQRPFNKGGEYILVLVYASETEFKKMRYSTRVLSDVMDLYKN